MRRVAVIGGGAAGVCAAITAAEAGAAVTVLERGTKPMKKLRATGNGRGNLMNTGDLRYYGDAIFAQGVLEAMPPDALRGFFERIGVTLTVDREGRVYPAALMAAVVADALSLRMRTLGIETIVNVRASSIERKSSGFVTRGVRCIREADTLRKNGKRKAGSVIEEESFELCSDAVIVAVGGMASPAFGTDGIGYALLTALGHTLVPTRSALCALLAKKGAIPKELVGQRVRARLALTDSEGSMLHSSEGEALFADDGVSGIAAMQLARFAEMNCLLHIDMRAAVLGDCGASAYEWALRRKELLGDAPVGEFLTGASSNALANLLLKHAGLDDARTVVSSLDMRGLRSLAEAIEDLTIPIIGTRGFEQAQVTAGGISTAEFDPSTMQSRLAEGVYAAGEALDVDGDCGGYNLMFAFASGLLAGRSAANM